MAKQRRSSNRAAIYRAIIEKIFFDYWKKGRTSFEFEREELRSAARSLHIDVPDNLGDVPYTFRYRQELPEAILETQPPNNEWIIEGAGRSRYRFKLVKRTRIVPRPDLITTGVPNATPEIIRAYAMDDEQALLAIVRYNRLIDIFLGITTYSLQNHLRTTVKGIGQIEIDEVYFGVDKHGCHYVIPVQAKAGRDKIGVVQIQQDLSWCAQRFPRMRCRAICVQFMTDERIAMFELTVRGGQIRIVDERHYKLIPRTQIDHVAVTNYRD